MASRRQEGFTLLELLVALAMAGIVLAALVSLFVSTNKVFTVENKITDIQQGARGAMQILSRDIRMAGLPRNATCSGIDTATATTIDIAYDHSGDGICGQDRQYQYDAANDQLEVIDSGGTPQPLVENVDSFALTYTLDDGSRVANPGNSTQIRMVNVVLCGQISGAYSSQFNSTYCFNSTVRCRNMGLSS